MSEARPEQVDEARIARGVAIGLPIVTVATAIAVGYLMGPATGILVLAAGLLLGVIAILWGSIRILSGDAPLPPDLEELDMRAQGNDPLMSRKKMLLRALKDLENERAIGKLETDDFEPIAAQYRAELKTVLTKIDEALAPTRALAEEAAQRYLEKAKLGTPKAEESEPDVTDESERPNDRVPCPKCGAKNEPDAKFCKECATKLVDATESEVSDA
ncbi:MAG: zinc-ribbon domain-containing protein [Labilithrix sp.]